MIAWAILLAAIGVILYLCLAILRPFLGVIAGSAVIAVAFYPVHRRLVAATDRPSLSALLATAVVVVTIAIPVGLIIAIAVDQFLSLKRYVEETSTRGIDLTAVEPARRAWEWLIVTARLDPQTVADRIAQSANDLAGLAAESALRIATNLTGVIIAFVFGVFTLFFLFRDGARLVDRIPDYLPLQRTQSEGVLLHIRDVINASVYGILVIGVIQGLLLGLAFWMLGIGSPAFWGVVTVFTGVIPMVGAAAIWLPGALYLLFTGAWIKALILVVLGTALISAVDNFLRPILVGGRAGLSELVIFFSVLGGLQVFGMLGIVIGPIVFATAGALLQVLRANEDWR